MRAESLLDQVLDVQVEVNDSNSPVPLTDPKRFQLARVDCLSHSADVYAQSLSGVSRSQGLKLRTWFGRFGVLSGFEKEEGSIKPGGGR